MRGHVEQPFVGGREISFSHSWEKVASRSEVGLGSPGSFNRSRSPHPTRLRRATFSREREKDLRPKTHIAKNFSGSAQPCGGAGRRGWSASRRRRSSGRSPPSARRGARSRH